MLKVIGVTMMQMNGKIKATFCELFNKQVDFQKSLLIRQGQIPTSNALPVDDLNWFTYHSLAMIEEMGEVMKADKRWKTHRNCRYKKDEKLDEIADVFITAMNMAMYSGFSGEDIQNAISNKIDENIQRVSK